MELPILLRCKMRVDRVERIKNNEGHVESEWITMKAVDHDPDNKEWSVWSPEASFQIEISNPNACKKLSLGDEFFVNFTPVPKIK